MSSARWSAAAAALMLGGMLGIAGITGSTEAEWTDATYASGEHAALILEPPTILSCTARALPRQLVIRWSFTAAHGSSDVNAGFVYSTDGVLTNLLDALWLTTTTGPDAGGVFTTTYDFDLLGIAVTRVHAGVRTEADGWVSQQMSTRVGSWPLLAAPSCTA